MCDISADLAQAKIFADRQQHPFHLRNGTVVEARERLAFKKERLAKAYNGLNQLKRNLGKIDLDDPDLLELEDLISSDDDISFGNGKGGVSTIVGHRSLPLLPKCSPVDTGDGDLELDPSSLPTDEPRSAVISALVAPTGSPMEVNYALPPNMPTDCHSNDQHLVDESFSAQAKYVLVIFDNKVIRF